MGKLLINTKVITFYKKKKRKKNTHTQIVNKFNIIINFLNFLSLSPLYHIMYGQFWYSE
jgi:hypothetical protein